MWNFLLFSYSPQGLEIKPKLRLLSSALTDLVSRLVLLGTLLLNCGGLNSCSLHDQPCLTTSPHAPCDPATQALPPVKEITHHSQDGPCAFITPCSCLFSSRPFHSFCISSFLPSEAFQSSAVTISLSSSLQLQTESVVSSAPIGALLYRTLMHTPFQLFSPCIVTISSPCSLIPGTQCICPAQRPLVSAGMNQ